MSDLMVTFTRFCTLDGLIAVEREPVPFRREDAPPMIRRSVMPDLARQSFEPLAPRKVMSVVTVRVYKFYRFCNGGAEYREITEVSDVGSSAR